MSLRFGIYAPTFGEYANPDLLVAHACAADEHGWEGYFIWDHLVSDDVSSRPVADAWSILPLLAQETDEILIGALVTPLARRELSKAALEAVTVDRISEGRLVFGAGLGMETDYLAFGPPEDRKELAKRLDDSLAALRRIWPITSTI